MKPIKVALWIFVIFFCTASLTTAFAAETITIAGTITEISTFPNMIAIDEGDAVTEVYGIRFNYLERQYNIVIETGMDVSVEAFENVCNDGTVRLKAASITVGDATIELGTTGSGRGRSGAGQGRNRVE